ncbi:MAG: VanZ family protein [Bacteroidaceae bacterium]|nr:VanZ family protein [Bacteroidaceae bacterium]
MRLKGEIFRPTAIMDYDLALVKKYMFQYDVGIPLYVILLLLAIVIGVIIGLYLTRKGRASFIRNSLLTMLGGYLFFVLCTTLIFRESSDTMRYFFLPFGSYDVLNYNIIAQLILNVLLFVPIGFLLGTFNGISWMQVIKIGCLLSVMIEILQLLTRRGVFNIDDVIHNIIGCAIGYGIFRLCKSILTAFTK